MDWDVATTLYYSDDPETITTSSQGRRDGVLFDFDIVPGQNQRLLFYHVNGDLAPRYIAVRLFNTGEASASLEYVESLPQGTSAYMHVGHASTAGFIRALVNADWRGVSVAPSQNVVLTSTELALEALAAGLLEFRNASSTVRCSIIACDQLGDVPAIAKTGFRFTSDGKGRLGKFSLGAFRAPLALTHAVGSAPTSLRIGERLIPNDEGRPNGEPGVALKGEYGVATHATISITNPTDAAATVALYQSAHGGDSTATYVIDGRIAESGRMISSKPPPRYKLWAYAVPANGQIRSQIATIPDSGSNSPIVLTLDADDGSTNPGADGSIVYISSLET